MSGSGRRNRLRGPVLAAVLAAGATLLVHLVDPNVPGRYGLCPLRALTGLACPGCGGLRAIHALTHGDLELAWGLNPVVVAVVPLAVLWWLRWVVRAWSEPSVGGAKAVPGTSRATPWLVLAGMVLFAVLRNLPALQPHLAALT